MQAQIRRRRINEGASEDAEVSSAGLGFAAGFGGAADGGFVATGFPSVGSGMVRLALPPLGTSKRIR